MIEIFYIAYLKKDSHWGIPAFENFLKSYEKNSAGIEHKLTILLRGFEDNLEDYQKIKEICKQKNIRTLDTTDIGFDFGAYLDGANQSNADYICCLNTTCEIMCNDWLKKLYSPIIIDNKYKMVGVSGSWEVCPNYVRDNRSITSKKDKFNLFFKKINLIRIGFRFLLTEKRFPNPSIRTSAFLIARQEFLDYFKKINLPQNKLEAYKIENGENSISNFISENGFEYCVVDKYGKIFDKKNFDKSGTYRSKLENYIIKDRQQEKYEKSNFLIKIYLRKIFGVHIFENSFSTYLFYE